MKNLMDARTAIAQLKLGNKLYTDGTCPAYTINEEVRMKYVIEGQHPFACIVSCADSRVVPERIFSCGLGDIFCVRVAGNVLGEMELGSVEYAALHLHVPLVTVLGHTHCGAVEAALKNEAPGGALGSLVHYVRKAIEPRTDARACERALALKGASRIRHDPALSSLIKKDELAVASALYDTETGIVSFLQTS